MCVVTCTLWLSLLGLNVTLLIQRGTSCCQSSGRCSCICIIKLHSGLKSLGASERRSWQYLCMGFKRYPYISIQGFNCLHRGVPSEFLPRSTFSPPEGGSWVLHLKWTAVICFRIIGLQCVCWPPHFLHWKESSRKTDLNFYQFSDLNVYISPLSTPKCVISGVCFWKLIPDTQIWWTTGYRHTPTYYSSSVPFTRTSVASKSFLPSVFCFRYRSVFFVDYIPVPWCIEWTQPKKGHSWSQSLTK